MSLNTLATQLGIPNIAEIYSPPRVTDLSERFGVREGVAEDLTLLDPKDHLPWDFPLPHKRARALRLLEKENPYLLVLSPMCKAFSMISRLNRARMGPKRWAAMQAAARVHVAFSMQRCQIAEGAGIPAPHLSWLQ